jgi:hypothetical protein
MPSKTKIVMVSILILLGGALFAYCAFFYPTEISTQAKAGSTAVTGAEAAPAKETSTGGIEQDNSNQPNQTRSERKPRPKAGAI